MINGYFGIIYIWLHIYLIMIDDGSIDLVDLSIPVDKQQVQQWTKLWIVQLQ